LADCPAQHYGVLFPKPWQIYPIPSSKIKNWDHKLLYYDISDNLDPPLSLSDSILFHPAKELAVSLPENDHGQVDIYIDNTIGITPNLQKNFCQVSRAIPLAI
jgi:hypothetical protein